MENNKIENSTQEAQVLQPHKKRGIIRKTVKKIYDFFSKPIPLMVLNGVLIAIIVFLNFNFQAFCNPTPWAIVVIAICFTNTILYPILEKTKFAPLASFINGVSLCLFIYCTIFFGLEWTIFGFIMIIVGIGLPILIPYFFIIQLIWKNIFRPKVKKLRYYFFASIIICMVIVVYIGQEYKKAMYSLEKCKETNFQEIDRNFMTEKILGMHFIYHMSYCPYDGWRPPKHEPIVVIGMWLDNTRSNPLEGMDLKTRLELYKKFFPDHKYKFDCACGKYGGAYHNDDLWK